MTGIGSKDFLKNIAFGLGFVGSPRGSRQLAGRVENAERSNNVHHGDKATP